MMEGLAFGRYRVTRKLGVGGMAEVYVAKHELMDRYAAVKLLLPEMSAREDIVKRFFQEAQAAACIDHPGIVQVYDVGYTEQGRAYLVMELLSGETLNERLRRHRRLSLDTTVVLIRQLAGIMEAAHQSGIIHRDLKPDNIFLVPDPEVPAGERVKVLDFGLAKLVEVTTPARELTAHGAVFGTPAYMAPEQCRSAANVDGRADVYAIGCVFYACLCGRPPFGTGGLEVLLAHVGEKPVPPRQYVPDIPPAIEALILRLLEKDPARRLPSCEALIAELDRAMAVTAQLMRDAGVQYKPIVNDEATIREDATLQGTVALLGALARAGSHDGTERAPDTYETSAAPSVQARDAHLIDTQRIPTSKPASAARAATDGGSEKETQPMRKSSGGLPGANRRLQTSQPVPLPGVAPMPPPATLSVPGVPAVRASSPAHLPGVPPVPASGPAPLPGVPTARASSPAHLPVATPGQSSGPMRMPAVTPMHARALRPVDMPWPGNGPDDAGEPRAGTEDDGRHGRGSTPTISNGEIEAHRKRALARDRKRARSRHMLWALVGAGFLAGLGAMASLPGRGETPETGVSAAEPVPEVLLIDPANGTEPVPPVETDPNLVQIDALLKQAEQDMVARHWEPASELLQQAAQHAGIDEEREQRALDLARRVAAEEQSQAALERMSKLGGLRNVEKLVAEFGKIPEDSVYRAEALTLYEAARKEWLESMSKRAERVARRGECQALAEIVEDTARLFPGAEAELEAQSAACEEPASEEDRDELEQQHLEAAQAAYKDNDITVAFARCREAWKVADDDETVAAFCGVVACKLQNEQAARRYYKHAGEHRGAIAQTCLREGMDIQK